MKNENGQFRSEYVRLAINALILFVAAAVSKSGNGVIRTHF